jgi:O-acetylserine/cysteine efflux transporter
MLVPVVGIGSSWLFLGDETSLGEIALGAVVLAGVVLGSQSPAAPPVVGHRETAPPAAPAVCTTA